MGHVINPVSHRLGYSTFWNSNWALSGGSNNTSYSYLIAENVLLSKYLKNIFLFATKKLFGKGLIFLGFKVLRFCSSITIIIESRIKQLPIIRRLLDRALLNTVGLEALQAKLLKIVNIKKFLLSRRNSINYKLKRVNSCSYLKKTNLITNNNSAVIKKKPLSLRYKIIPKFVRRVGRLTKYNNAVTEPDFRSYHWSTIVNILDLKHRQTRGLKKKSSKVNQKLIVYSCMRYLLVSRWLKSLKIFLFSSLRRFYSTLPQLNLVMSIFSNTALTATFIAKYLATRLLQKFPLRRLITLLVRQLKIAANSAIIHGFKISCSGRFERRGRASHTWKLVGKVPFSDINMHVDYAIMLPVLTNSICAVKVWITKKHSTEKLLIL
jgi:hypothetical protein